MDFTSLTNAARNNWKVLLPLATVATAVLAWLVFGLFAVHTLFIEEAVDEALPEFSTSSETSDPVEEEPTSPTDEEADEQTAAPTVLTLVEGMFIDRDHPTSGSAKVLNDGSSQRFLRFEDFVTDNGPDLNVYLSSASPDASNGELGADFIDLGDLKGNVGPQNYEIGADVDLDRYSTVVIWCVRFGVPFGSAGLAPAA